MDQEIKDQLKIILDKLTSIELDQAFLMRKILEPKQHIPAYKVAFSYSDAEGLKDLGARAVTRIDTSKMDEDLEIHSIQEAEKLNIFPRVYICKNGDRKVACNQKTLDAMIAEDL